MSTVNTLCKLFVLSRLLLQILCYLFLGFSPYIKIKLIFFIFLLNFEFIFVCIL